MKIKKPLVLVVAIIICQLAGIVGSFFTVSAIPTWYVTLVKPTFNPPSWLFGPAWTFLYTLMGIALYRVWLKGPKKKDVMFALRVFGVHLLLNALWSIIFFGMKNPGWAFFEIVVLWLFIIYTTKLFWKIERVAGILLLPYLAWVSFAMILNFAIWNLNPTQNNTVFAQEFDYQKAYSDYSFKKDQYQSALTDFKQKKDSYLQNSTLSLKEEVRVSLLNLLVARNEVVSTYLTALRMRILESDGLTKEEKDAAISKITNDHEWFEEQRLNYSPQDTLEDLLDESKNEDERLGGSTSTTINYALSVIGYADVVSQKQKHERIQKSLKDETDSLVNLGRADSSLFERWFSDINTEFASIQSSLSESKQNIEKILSAESYAQKSSFKTVTEELNMAKTSLLKINQYLYELEVVVEEKR